MNKRGSKLLVGFVMFILIATLSPSVFCQSEPHAESPTSLSSNQTDSFTPAVWKPAGVDQDNNRIADSLDQEIADRMANGTVQDYASVTVMLKAAPTTQDVDDFVSSSGQVTTNLWTKATYGFGGKITYEGVVAFAQKCPDLLLVQKEVVDEACVAYAAQQVGARTYVWNTVGLQGDPNLSIAVLDTGIDGSHLDFSPGYGDQDFSKKIVGWKDYINSTFSPFDDEGHGSHCAGLAAGDGFFSVDATGRATATWGRNLTGSSGSYNTGMMVNNTGNITLSLKWLSTGTAKLSTLYLYDSGKSITSWNQVASKSVPDNNTWYTLTYTVASVPLGGYDMYNPVMSVTSGTGNLYVVVNMSWPYTPPADGFSAWTGIAPQSKLVGIKRLDSAGHGIPATLIDSVEWIMQNKVKYHITVVSISSGYDSEVPQVNQAILSLVNSGITTVIAAGNNGAGANKIHSPASVDETITVAAMNQFDDITDYSSQGGTSFSTGNTVKPDIAAPGGSFNSVPLFSVDSNYNDAEGGFADVQANDAAPMQGTSMSAPVISGCAQIVIQAMGGYAKWNWTRSQALQPKMILLMTATETYPNLREGGTSSTSPTLDRGGKDVHEGYGRVNLDAAVDAVLSSYGIGTVATDSLGKPPTLADISVLGQRLAWARNVQLASGFNYNFSLSVPAGADYDLYLYNSTGTSYGDPAIVAKSINATTGGIEQFWATAPYTGTYYLVVKRATETTGSGTFTLASSGPTTLTLESDKAWYQTSTTTINSVASGDVDNDGFKEIITGGSFYDGVRNNAQLIVWNGANLAVDRLTSWYSTGNTTINSVAIGDVDGDGQVEIVTGGYFNDGARNNAQLMVWNGANLAVDRQTSWYWTGNTVINSVAVGDVDGDSQVEVVTAGYYNDGVRNNAQLIEWNGANLAVDRLFGWYWTSNTVINSVAVGDVDNDGLVEVVTGGYYNDGTRNNAQLIEWNGATLAADRLFGWCWTSNTVINSVAVGDVDNDGLVEVASGGYYNDGTRNNAQLIEWNGANLALDRLTGWYWTGNTAINSVAVGDMNGDGQVEIVTGGFYNDGARDVAQLSVWSGSNLVAENIKSWYWTGNTVINSVSIGDVNGDALKETVTGGSFHDGTRLNSQLTVWGMS